MPSRRVNKAASARAARGGGTETSLTVPYSAPYQMTSVKVGMGRGVIQGNGADWFGPLNPQTPAAPPEVSGRILDYPTGYNLNIRPRAYEPVTFETMRALADGYDLMRLVIETRKDQMAALDWNIVPRDRKVKIEGAVADRVKGVEEFFIRPDKANFWDAWLRMLLEDLLVIDAPTLHLRRTRGGDLYSLEQLDGATIKRVIDDWGRTPEPPTPAYQQVLKGLPAVDYTSDELMYRPRNQRVHKVYGYSPVEQVIMTVNIALRRQVFQLNYFTEGTVPEALIGVPETWTPDQIRQFQDWFDSILTGNLAERRRARFVPAAMAKTYVETKQGELFGQAEEWFAKVICFAFSISPQPFLKMMNRATAENAHEVALEEGLAPLQKWVKSLVDTIIIDEFGYTDLEFSWADHEELDPAARQQILEGYTSKGIMTLNEARGELGLDPFDDDAFNKPMVVTSTGYVFVSPEDQATVNGQPNSPVPNQQQVGIGPGAQSKPGKPDVVGAEDRTKEVKEQASEAAAGQQKAEAKKYDPGQDRDEHGRFAGGGTGVLAGVHPVAAGALGPKGVAAVKGAIANGASQEETLKALEPMYAAADHNSNGPTMSLDEHGNPPAGFFENRNYGTAENPRSFDQTMDHLTTQAKAYAGPGGPAQGHEAVLLLGPPAAGKSSIAEQMATSTRSAIVDPDDAKKEIPEYRGGLGAGDVHEESSAMGKILEARLTSSGTNIIVPTVGANQAGIETRIDRLQSLGYSVKVVDVAVDKDEAARRMAGRALSTGRVIAAHAVIHTGDKPSATYDAVKGRANGYARIDNSGPPGSARTVESFNFHGFTAGKSLLGRGGSTDGGLRGSTQGGQAPGLVRSQQEVLGKAASAAPNFDRPRVQRAVLSLKKALKGHLKQAGVDVAGQVQKRLKKLGKADDSVNIDLILKSLDLSVFEAMEADLEDELDNIAADSAQIALGQIGMDDPSSLFNQANERAATWAKAHAAKLVGTSNDPKFALTDSTRDMLRGVIAEGLDQGLDSATIADNIQGSYAFSEDRAALIANTEIRRANSAGAVEGYREARDSGVNIQKEWLLGNEPCDECEENADEGPIDLDEDFPSGDSEPPAHPNCNCSVSPVVASGDGGEEEEGDE